TAIDRESAYEILEKKEAEAAERAEKLAKEEERAKREAEKTTSRRRRTSSRRQSVWEKEAKLEGRRVMRKLTDYVLRGILGGRR
ncbi:MAG: helicase HerA-like domain-containing protein, partial [Pseudomonadota bacterium]